jgi:hypothetical protein
MGRAVQGTWWAGLRSRSGPINRQLSRLPSDSIPVLLQACNQSEFDFALGPYSTLLTTSMLKLCEKVS